MIFFFLQAEDGIRDLIVTGVQTCALPIFALQTERHVQPLGEPLVRNRVGPLERDGRQRARLVRSEEHTSELQSRSDLVCRLLLEKKKKNSVLVDTRCTAGIEPRARDLTPS